MNKIEGLNGLRALAAATVVATHMGWYSYISRPDIVELIHGWAGVQLFFVLSGFLITRLLLFEWETTGTLHLRYFFARRAFRILPLYFIIILMVLFITLFVSPKTNKEGLIMAALNVYNYVPKSWYSTTLGHLWSLGVEEHFYLFWPFFLTLLLRLRSRSQVYVLGFLAVLSLVAFPVTTTIPDFNKQFFTERWTTSVGYNLLFGALGAIVLCSSTWPAKFRQKAISFMRSRLTLAIAGVLCINHLVFDITFLNDVLRGLGFTLLIAWIYSNQQSAFVSALSIPPLDYIGKVSYGIYMYQGVMLTTGPERDPNSAWPPSPEIGLLIVFIVVPISYHLIEKPLIKIGSRFRTT